MATTEKGRDLDKELSELKRFLQTYDRKGIGGLDSFGIRKLERNLDRTWKCLSEYKRELNTKKTK